MSALPKFSSISDIPRDHQMDAKMATQVMGWRWLSAVEATESHPDITAFYSLSCGVMVVQPEHKDTHQWHPSVCSDDARLAETRIKELGLHRAYVQSVLRRLRSAKPNRKVNEAIFDLVHVSPRIRCAAMIAVCQKKR
jgi:hypothetical protein